MRYSIILVLLLAAVPGFAGELPQPVAFDLADHPDIDLLLDGHELRDELLKAFEYAGGNIEEILTAVREIEPSRREDLFRQLSAFGKIDLLTLDAAFLLRQIRDAYAAAAGWRDYTLEPEILREALIEPRIGPYEHVVDWRGYFFSRIRSLRRETIGQTARRIEKRLRGHLRLLSKEDIFGNFPDPVTVYRRGWGSRRELAVTAVAMLRSLGIAARLSDTRQWAEYYDGTDWIALYPAGEPEEKEIEEAYAERAVVELHLTRNGIPLENLDTVGFARWHDGTLEELDPRNFPIELDEETEKGDGICRIILPGGEYLFTAGTRNGNGDPRIIARHIRLEPGEKLLIEQEIGIPWAEKDAGEHLVRSLETIPEFSWTDHDGTERTLAATAKESPVLLVFYDASQEPSRRMLPLVADAVDGLRAQQRLVRTIYINDDDTDTGDLIPADAIIVTDSERTLAGEFQLPARRDGALHRLPSVLLLAPGGTAVFWQEGYNLNIGDWLMSVGLQTLPATEQP